MPMQSYKSNEACEMANKHMPQTGIICTIGPSTQSLEKLVALINNGMSIARINMSHCPEEMLSSQIRLIQEARKCAGRFVAIAIDTIGPAYLVDSKVNVCIEKGDSVIIYNDSKNIPKYDDAKPIKISVNTLAFLQKNDIIKIDEGKLELNINSVSDRLVEAIALGSHKTIQGKHVTFPRPIPGEHSPTNEDIRHIALGVQHGADMVFLSFVESAESVKRVRKLLVSLGASADKIQIIAKIETAGGLSNLESIAAVSDCVMAARGDLLSSVGLDSAFSAQKRISACGKPVIMATEMAQSMVSSVIPTRAEISDIGNAVCDGCCAVMLSAETAVGKNPILSTDVVRRVCLDAELYLMSNGKKQHLAQQWTDMLERRKAIVYEKYSNS